MMHSRRVAAPILAATAALSFLAAAGAQSKRSQAAHTTPASAVQPAATVNGTVITRGAVLDQVWSIQQAQLAVTNPQAKMRANRELAAAIGTLVLKKMQTSPGQPVSLTRADVAKWVFDEKPTILLQTLDLMIKSTAIKQEAQKRHIAYTEKDLDAKEAESLAPLRNQSPTYLNKSTAELLKEAGYPRDYWRNMVAAQLLAEKVLEDELDKKLGHKVSPADFIEASHIFVKVTPQSPAETEKAYADGLAKIKGFEAEVKTGKFSFEDEASRNSEDGSKLRKGSLGVFMRGQMVAEFEKVAFNMEPGKMSEPIRSPFGWHLIKVNRLGKDTTAPERDQALKQYINQQITGGGLQKILADAKIKNYVFPQNGGAVVGSR